MRQHRAANTHHRSIVCALSLLNCGDVRADVPIECVRVSVEIDTSSAPALATSILMRWHGGAAYRYPGPHTLANRWSQKQEPVGRDESFAALRRYMSAVYRSRVARQPARVPLAATASAPGGGKSRFLDELGTAYGRAQLQLCPSHAAATDRVESELSAQIEKMVLVNLTFNSHASVSALHKRDTGEEAAAVRILYEYVLFRVSCVTRCGGDAGTSLLTDGVLRVV
jgi:hypothetical protein